MHPALPLRPFLAPVGPDEGGLLRLLSPLLSLLDGDVTDLVVDGGGRVFVERADGRRHAVLGVCPPRGDLEAAARLVLLSAGEDEAGAVALPDGTRLQAMRGDLCHGGGGPWLALRRRATNGRTALLDAAQFEALRQRLVDRHQNLLIVGPAGAGKTSLAQALLDAVPRDERVYLLQDVEELRPPPGAQGWGSFRVPSGRLPPMLAHLVRLAPDRLVVGECRGPEAWSILDLFASGHDGGLTTLHARGAAEGIARLEALARLDARATDGRSIRARIAAAFGCVVALGRPVRGVRAVTEVVDLVGVDAQGQVVLRPLWLRDPDTRAA